MNKYPALNDDFTRKGESDKIKSNKNSYPTLSNQTPHSNPSSNEFGDFAKENYYHVRSLLGLD